MLLLFYDILNIINVIKRVPTLALVQHFSVIVYAEQQLIILQICPCAFQPTVLQIT